MGYKKNDAVGTLIKVIGTNLGKAGRAHTGIYSKNPRVALWAKNTIKMAMGTIGRAIASILRNI